MSKKHHKHDEQKPPPPASWMVSFCDLLTLLLCFFVLLLTMRAMDDRKFEQAFGSFSGAFGVLAKNDEVGPDHVEVPPMGTPVPEIVTKDVQAVLESTLRVEPRGHIAGDNTVAPEPRAYRHLFLIELTDESIDTRIASDVLFQPGTATLVAGARDLLREIGTDLARASADLRVESYVEPGADEEEPWRLSLERAATVAEALAEAEPLGRARLSVMGYGRVAPKSPEGARASVAILARTSVPAAAAASSAPVAPASTRQSTTFDPYRELLPEGTRGEPTQLNKEEDQSHE